MAFLNKSSDSKTGGVVTNHAARFDALPLQASLRMGRPNDTFEQEADRTADRVVNSPDSTAHDTVQRQPEEEEPIQTRPLIGDISRFVQKQTEEEEEEPVQAQAEEEEEEPVQTQAQEEEEEPVQYKAIAASDIGDPETGQLLAASKSGGRPLEPEILKEMETKFGTNFSHVRIHTDKTAVELCRTFNAKAFTHGSHIYFNEGNYQPGSSEGKRLLAHELTHVIQQTGRIEREMIQRENDGEVPVDGTQLPTSVGRISTNDENPENGRIFFDQVQVPPFKLAAHRGGLYGEKAPLVYRKNYTRGNPNQRNYWKENINKGEIKNSLRSKIRTANHSGSVDEGATHIIKVKLKGRPNPFYIGKLDEIATQLTTPIWGGQSNNPEFRSFDVDHIVELQLANWSGSGWPNTLANMELLDSGINQASGRSIKQKIDARLQGFIDATHGRYGNSPASLKNKYHIEFERAVSGGNVERVNSDKFWQQSQIEAADHLNAAAAASFSDIGGDGLIMVFSNEFGGIGKQFRYPGGLTNDEKKWFNDPFEIKSKNFNISDESAESTDLGHFTVNVKPGDPNWEQFEDGDKSVSVQRYIGAQYAGYINKNSVLYTLRSLRLKKASPVAVDSLTLLPDRGIVAQGRVLTDIPLIENADIQFEINNGEFILFKTFRFNEINIPSPFTISELGLTLFAGTQKGLGVEGRADFGIENVGEGFIGAATSTGGGFELEGRFDFDSSLFQPAWVNVTYRDKTFGVTGQLGIPAGKVCGIRSATINVSYTEGTLRAEGEAELDIPGVENGRMQVEYGEGGFSIGGTFNLSGDFPGIRSGSIRATVCKVAGEEGYRLTAGGTAVPDIPGIDSQLTVEYDNGAITAHARASYNRGLLSGEINVGATNRALDGEGQPTGEPTPDFIVYGSGSLTIRITPWLQGTVGVQFQPNGEMVVSGRIGLPSSIEVFRRIGIPERELFSIGFDIPIFAIPVGPRSIGLVATIRGGLKAYAGIGPGRLEQLELGVEYNPARPEETHVTGQGRFVIPADAGLRLFVRAGIGLSAVVGGVEGGLELAGGIGLEAAAEADINVDWRPSTGLELKANLSASVEPKFVFTIDGFIRAWILFYEKEWRWRLADYEYGSNMRFGVRLPIHYRQGEPFDISFDDLVIERPTISARSFLSGLIQDIRGNRN